jgi:hypothetical protein
VRRILRNRSRYEVANNSYARGIVLTLANDVVGTGPRLQLLTGDAEANARIEREFLLWSRSVGLAEKLRTMRVARAEDGEAFAVLISNPALPTAIKLDLRLIEADQVCTPDLMGLAANSVDGIVFDQTGNSVEYVTDVRTPAKEKDKSLCQYPVTEGLTRPSPKCMAMIRPDEVLQILERYS